ncbi:MAG TPA: SDR family oxidoreductase [Tepidisphaeraceae bacterium]|nr:SDR family oxidoreductase [Tepidisphaeraceae bacterium]
MARHILITGGTGALGPPLIARVLAHDADTHVHALAREAPAGDPATHLRAAVAESAGRDALARLHPVAGNVRSPGLGIDSSVAADLVRRATVLLHAAADTRFRAPPDDQRATNVAGTAHALDFAARCPRLTQFVFVSTTCVAGTRTGVIPESLHDRPPAFTNFYEQTKWDAERLVAARTGPTRIVRLSTVAGDARTGQCRRPGALHHSMRWLFRGLIPMVPAAPDAPLDIISTQTAVDALARAADTPPHGLDVCHVAAGARAPRVADVLDLLIAEFAARSPAWRRGQLARPDLVDAVTFDLFRDGVRRTRDPLLSRVLDSVEAFLPGLLFPKTYDTTRGRQLHAPADDWQSLVRNVFAHCADTNWARDGSHASAPQTANQPEVDDVAVGT